MQQQRQIGHYIIGKKIGQGNSKLEARHSLTNARVAVKILNKKLMIQQKMIAEVRRQILILSQFNHDKIIKFYEIIYTTAEILIFMELAQGGQLYEYVYQKDVCQVQARFFFKQIISGVAYSHTNRIAHRDLKLQNILMVNNKSIKIADFGLSNLMYDGKSLQTLCGSPQYYAPQIAAGKRYEGTSVDIWSCGVMLYAMLTKQLPFNQDSPLLQNRKIMNGDYKIPKQVSPLARDLITRMMQVDPYKRIRMQELIIHPWFCSHIPMYAHVPIYFKIQLDKIIQINTKIFQKTKEIITSTKSDDVLKQMIKKRNNNNFTITYQILVDEHFRGKINTQQINCDNLDQNNVEDGVFYSRKNVVTSKVQCEKSIGIYGKRFTKPIYILQQIVVQNLNEMDIQHQSSNSQFNFNCIYLSPVIIQFRCRKSTAIFDDRETRAREKFSNQQIKFILQIFKEGQKGYNHIIDLQLTQGHPLVFFRLSKILYDMIQYQCVHH